MATNSGSFVFVEFELIEGFGGPEGHRCRCNLAKATLILTPQIELGLVEPIFVDVVVVVNPSQKQRL